MNIESYSVLDESFNQDFFTNVLPLKDNFTSIKVPITFINTLQNTIVSFFNLHSIQDLRDKFEGVAYYDKKLRTIGAYKSIEVILNIKTNFSKTEVNLEQKYTSLTFRGETYNLIVFRFGQLPKIHNSYSKKSIIIMQRDLRYFYFCGVLETTCKDFTQNQTFIELKDFKKLIKPKDFLNNDRNK